MSRPVHYGMCIYGTRNIVVNIVVNNQCFPGYVSRVANFGVRETNWHAPLNSKKFSLCFHIIGNPILRFFVGSAR